MLQRRYLIIDEDFNRRTLRIIFCLKVLYRCLMSYDEDFVDGRGIERVAR